MKSRGLMFILSSPSGAGKTTLAKLLLANDSNLTLSVSCTTRKPREGEINGKDYHFVEANRFIKMRENGEFLEWANVHGNEYGTPRARVEEALEKGVDVLFDVDWQGAIQISQNAPCDVVKVFILPPSGEALANRLHRRSLDAKKTINRRLKNACKEILHFKEYDYVLINQENQIDSTYEKLRLILQAERMRLVRQCHIEQNVNKIVNELNRIDLTD